jgi:NNP family nitrate/nitrite transporter-like MFS transporter
LHAGYATAAAALAGSAARPFGGWLADRIGGIRLLSFVLVAVACAYGLASLLLPFGPAASILIAGMVCLGLGNGAVFQVVPLRFPRGLGAVTGLVGALGGVGGFFLPTLLGTVKQASGSFGPAFLVLAALAGTAAVALRLLVWSRQSWPSTSTGSDLPDAA